MKKVKGFTLVELLVVITIILVLAGMLFPALQAVIKKARIANAISDMKGLGTAWVSMKANQSTSASTVRLESSEWNALQGAQKSGDAWESKYSTQALWKFYSDGRGTVTDGRIFISPNKRHVNNEKVPGFTALDEEFKSGNFTPAKSAKERDQERAHDCEISYGLTYGVSEEQDEGKRIIIADMGRTERNENDTSIKPFEKQSEIPSIDDLDNGKFGFRNFDSEIIVLYNGINASDINTVAPEDSSEDVGIYTTLSAKKTSVTDATRLRKSTYIPAGDKGQDVKCVAGCYHNNVKQ